ADVKIVGMICQPRFSAPSTIPPTVLLTPLLCVRMSCPRRKARRSKSGRSVRIGENVFVSCETPPMTTCGMHTLHFQARLPYLGSITEVWSRGKRSPDPGTVIRRGETPVAIIRHRGFVQTIDQPRDQVRLVVSMVRLRVVAASEPPKRTSTSSPGSGPPET